MLSNKAIVHYKKYYTRKDRRANAVGMKYKSYFHYNRRSRLKPIRQDANQSLRRYKGDVSDHGWYKKYYDVMWIAW